MVKPPKEDLEYHLQNLREWANPNEINNHMHVRPISLLELEEFADLAVSYMLNVTFTPVNTDQLRQTAINRIRQLFNMEFKLCCDVCGTAHYQDEVTAPER